jgi:hypothetical protein
MALSLCAGAAYSQTAAPPVVVQNSPAVPHGMIGHTVLPGTGHPASEANLASGWNQRHCEYLEWYNNGTDEYIYAINWEGDSIYAAVASGSGANPAGVTLEKVCAEKAAYWAYYTGSYVEFILTPYP